MKERERKLTRLAHAGQRWRRSFVSSYLFDSSIGTAVLLCERSACYVSIGSSLAGWL